MRFIYPEGSNLTIEKGDSGGPVYIEWGGVRELIGITSSISVSKPAVFATWLSPSLASWIQATLDDLNRDAKWLEHYPGRSLFY